MYTKAITTKDNPSSQLTINLRNLLTRPLCFHLLLARVLLLLPLPPPLFAKYLLLIRFITHSPSSAIHFRRVHSEGHALLLALLTCRSVTFRVAAVIRSPASRVRSLRHPFHSPYSSSSAGPPIRCWRCTLVVLPAAVVDTDACAGGDGDAGVVVQEVCSVRC